MKQLEELEKLERMDPNDPRLDSVAAAMKLNLAEMQKHQESKDHNDTNQQTYDYSQKKYYPNIIGYVSYDFEEISVFTYQKVQVLFGQNWLQYWQKH